MVYGPHFILESLRYSILLEEAVISWQLSFFDSSGRTAIFPETNSIRGQKDHINIRISHSGSKAKDKRGIPETLFGRILMVMWSSWASSMGAYLLE